MKKIICWFVGHIWEYQTTVWALCDDKPSDSYECKRCKAYKITYE